MFMLMWKDLLYRIPRQTKLSTAYLVEFIHKFTYYCISPIALNNINQRESNTMIVSNISYFP